MTPNERVLMADVKSHLNYLQQPGRHAPGEIDLIRRLQQALPAPERTEVCREAPVAERGPELSGNSGWLKPRTPVLFWRIPDPRYESKPVYEDERVGERRIGQLNNFRRSPTRVCLDRRQSKPAAGADGPAPEEVFEKQSSPGQQAELARCRDLLSSAVVPPALESEAPGRCEPPPEHQDKVFHWLVSPSGISEIALWGKAEKIWLVASMGSLGYWGVDYWQTRGWRYHAPAIPPEPWDASKPDRRDRAAIFKIEQTSYWRMKRIAELEAELARAKAPSVPAEGCVKVRIAAQVCTNGNFYVVACNGSATDANKQDRLMGPAIPGAIVVWITADLPIPKAVEIVGRVE